MILADIFAYLKADSGLASLLGASDSNPKIYPNISKLGEEPPFVVYRALNAGGAAGDILREEEVQLLVFAPDFASLSAISGRLIALLDQRDQTELTSSSFFIYSSKYVSGTDLWDDAGCHGRSMVFLLKFRSKA